MHSTTAAILCDLQLYLKGLLVDWATVILNQRLYSTCYVMMREFFFLKEEEGEEVRAIWAIIHHVTGRHDLISDQKRQWDGQQCR